jgi:hypothetical protein
MFDLIAGTTVDEWIALYLALVGFASFIVKLTPTQKDDKILAKIVHFVSKFIALNDKDK